MSAIKNAFHNIITLREQAEANGVINLELAKEMLRTIEYLEAEVSLYQRGYSNEAVEKAMAEQFDPMDWDI